MLIKLPGVSTPFVAAEDVALIEICPKDIEVVMSSASNGFVHHVRNTTDTSVEPLNNRVVAQIIDDLAEAGISMMPAYDGLWVRPEMVSCVSFEHFGSEGVPSLAVYMRANAGGRPHRKFYFDEAHGADYARRAVADLAAKINRRL